MIGGSVAMIKASGSSKWTLGLGLGALGQKLEPNLGALGLRK